MKLFGIGDKDVGIDLGTANMLVTLKRKGNCIKRTICSCNR